MRIKSILAASGVLAMLAAFLAPPAVAQQTSGPVAPVCASCHEAQWKAIDLSAHGAKNDAQGSMCQACHGNAADHLKDPMKAKPDNPFGKGHTADERTTVCLACHSGNRNLAFWTSGKHQLNEVTCANCHSIHGEKLFPSYSGLNPVQKSVSINKFTTTFLPNQAEICWQCHQPIRAANFKPSHHPIIEGKVKCSDCHNPHGSVHARLLNESAPNLCQDCHDWSRHPGTVYGASGAFNCQAGDTARTNVGTPPVSFPNCPPSQIGQPNPGVNNRLVSRACLNCHSNIHGSNAPANRGKFFLR